MKYYKKRPPECLDSGVAIGFSKLKIDSNHEENARKRSNWWNRVSDTSIRKNNCRIKWVKKKDKTLANRYIKPATLKLATSEKKSPCESFKLCPSHLEANKLSVKFTSEPLKIGNKGKILESSESHQTFTSLISNDDHDIVDKFSNLAFRQSYDSYNKDVADDIVARLNNLAFKKFRYTDQYDCKLLKSPHVLCSETSYNNQTIGDDTTINELACYLDSIVHIPKKMSIMAEMMYV